MPKRIELKVGLFIVITSLLVIISVLYIAYSKGYFAKEQIYTLSIKSGQEISEGMPLFFSGFKIGKVEKLELNDQGLVHVKITIPDQHAKWIRTSSTFSINKPLIGSSKLVVSTPDLNSPPLSPKIIREIFIVDDINETIKKLDPILENINKVVANIEGITGKLSEKKSLIEMAVGTPQSTQSIHDSIKKANDLLSKLDKIASKTDEQVFGNDGALPLVRKILKDILVKLEKLNTTLDNVTNMSSDAAASTKDLKLLRSQIDSTVNSIGNLINEIDKLIPFKKEPKIKLP